MKQFVIVLCFLSLSIQSQVTKTDFSEKTFQAKIGSVCEETPDDNPCAGYETFIKIKFKKDKITISEIEISSCDKETIYSSSTYHWKLLNDVFIIRSDPEKYLNIKNLILGIRDEKITGFVIYDNERVEEYQFSEILK